MADMRQELIAATITAELRRQDIDGVDVQALAAVIARLPLPSPEKAPTKLEDEGMKPGELNAANDD